MDTIKVNMNKSSGKANWKPVAKRVRRVLLDGGFGGSEYPELYNDLCNEVMDHVKKGEWEKAVKAYQEISVAMENDLPYCLPDIEVIEV